MRTTPANRPFDVKPTSGVPHLSDMQNMKNRIAILLSLVFCVVTFAEHPKYGSTVEHHEAVGYFMNVYDHRPETLAFMEENHLQGGGPTWMALVRASLEMHSPATLRKIRFDDESDVVLVTSDSKEELEKTQVYVKKLMEDTAFRKACIEHSEKKGYLE